MLTFPTKADAYRHFHDYPKGVDLEDAGATINGKVWKLHYNPGQDIFTEDLGRLRLAAFRGPLINNKG